MHTQRGSCPPWPTWFHAAAVLLLTTIGVAVPTGPAGANVYVVQNLEDAGPNSLRGAMNNARNIAGPDDIVFAAALSGTITLETALPVIEGAASRETRFLGETNPSVIIDGNNGGFDGVVFGQQSGDSVIRGLTITGCENAIVVHGEIGGLGPGQIVIGGDAPAHRNVLTGNTNGLWVEGDLKDLVITNTRAVSNDGDGLVVGDDAFNFTVGGTGTSEFNVFSGNGGVGVRIEPTDDFDVSHILFQENRIGVAADGATPLPNGSGGVHIFCNASALGIISDLKFVRNIVSSNTGHGFLMGGAVSGLAFAGNFIGVDETGQLDRGNTGNGVLLESGASVCAFQHPDSSGVRPNVISGNGGDGILISGTGTDQNRIEGCFVGVDASGADAIPNLEDGVRVTQGAAYNSVSYCVIAANGLNGVHLLAGSHHTTVDHSTVGLDATGMVLRPNGGAPYTGGIHIEGGSIQDPNAAHSNTLFANRIASHASPNQFGVGLDGPTYGNDISANFIGTDPTGVVTQANYDGIWISIGFSNLVQENVISCNSNYGIADYAGSLNQFHRNLIGTDATGLLDSGNGSSGIYLSSGETIGGLLSSDEGNLISGNDGWGIEAHVYGVGVWVAPTIQGNRVGVAQNGGALGNDLGGIWLGTGISGAWVGSSSGLAGTDAANEIAWNGATGTPGCGVRVGESDSGLLEAQDPLGNRIQCNRIHDNVGAGIEIDLDFGDPGNLDIARPTVDEVTTTLIEGSTHLTGVPVVVQVFTDTEDEGEVYLGDATVAAGKWTFTPATLTPGDHITATNTALVSGAWHTSEFSVSVEVPTPPPSPTFTTMALPDLGGDAIAFDAVEVPLALSAPSRIVVGGSAFPSGDPENHAMIWESDVSFTTWEAIDLGPGSIRTVHFADEGPFLLVAGGRDSTGAPAITKDYDYSFTALPTPQPFAPGEVLSISSDATSQYAVGWSEVQGVQTATVWQSEDLVTWTPTAINADDSAGPSAWRDVAIADGVPVAVGFVTAEGGAMHASLAVISFDATARSSDLFGNASCCDITLLPQPTGAVGSAANALASTTTSTTVVGWYRNASGELRALKWERVGESDWLPADLGSISGNPESVAADIAFQPNGDETATIIGESIAASGVATATAWWNDQLYPLVDLGPMEAVFFSTRADCVLTGTVPSGASAGSDTDAYVAVQRFPTDVPTDDPDIRNVQRLALSVWPNPSYDRTTLLLEVPAGARAQVDIHDVTGRAVARLVESGAGTSLLEWGGRDQAGHLLPRGAYFARAHVEGTAVTRRIIRE